MRQLVEAATGVFTGIFYSSFCESLLAGKLFWYLNYSKSKYEFKCFASSTINRNWILSFEGLFGGDLPHNSGLTSVINGHGHYSPLELNSTYNEKTTSKDTSYQMEQTNGTAILLIRNPYHAIYGYRHYMFAERTRNTYANNFLYEGKFY